MGSKKTENVFVFEQKYFTDPNFLQRFNRDIKKLRTLIRHGNEPLFVRDTLNAFMKACFTFVADETIRIHMHLEFYVTLAHYAELNSSEQTFENIIADFERADLKSKLFGKQPMRSCIVFGETLLKYYGLKNEQSKGWFTEDGFGIITKAKYYILKAYSQSIEGKNKFSETDKSYCFVLLAACYMHLSRWFEPIFYLSQLKKRDLTDPNFDYLTALNLDALMEKSCLDYNGQLLLKIIECGTKVLENPSADSRQKDHIKEVIEKSAEHIRRAKLSIPRLKKHKNKIEASSKKLNQYYKFCIDNQLFLNEHLLFCNCSRSIGDTLEIKTQHQHTHIKWVSKFEKILELLITDFAIARGNFYQGSTSAIPSFRYKKENLKTSSMRQRKDALLKNSFRICYSILDQICYGVFETLEIDIEKSLREKSSLDGRPVPNLYFLNMWDLYKFSPDDFKSNLYLISLFSISKDLDRTEYAALRAFKDYRNAMEHKFLFIVESDKELSSELRTSKWIKRDELIAKTKLLLLLTKSAILSFAYLVRRQSKIRELNS